MTKVAADDISDNLETVPVQVPGLDTSLITIITSCTQLYLLFAADGIAYFMLKVNKEEDINNKRIV